VTFKVTGSSRESAIREFELQGRAPDGKWATLAKTAPAEDSQNGPRIQVPVTFSLRLGESNPQKPLMPADLRQAGTWEFRARVLSTAGTWSDWSDIQPVLAVVPLQTVTLQGRTLPPVQDADWFTASATQSYPLQVWVP
jgi:hypothetical protein